MDKNIPETAELANPEPVNLNITEADKLKQLSEQVDDQKPVNEQIKTMDGMEKFLTEKFEYKMSDGFIQNSDIFEELSEIKFNEQIRAAFICNSCHLVLWKPVSLKCGHTICDSCQSCIDNEGSCPIDQQAYQICDTQILDSLQGDIVESRIHCIEIECPWIGKLKELEGHFSNCSFRKVECPHCDEIVKVDDLDNHVLNTCDYRMVTCQYCSSPVNYKDIENHENGCNTKPVPCPNECKPQEAPNEVTILKQGDLENHLSNECQDRKIACQFAAFNCSKMLTFRKVNIHLIKNSLTHLEDLCSGNRKATDILESQLLQMIDLKKQIASNNMRINHLQLKCGPQLLWKVVNVKEKCQEAIKNKSNELLSAAFYSTSPYGYKLLMRLMLNGSSAVSSGRYISVFISICDNPYNNLLTWPFQQKVTVHLINQTSDNHVSYTIVPNPVKENLDYLNKPPTDRNPFFGIDKFIPCSVIDGETEYVVDNTMYIKVNIEPYHIV